jgi:hypothetical protein
LGGGDRLKFSDVIVAVATLVVVAALLEAVFVAVFIPMISHAGFDVAGILSTLVASLIVGYLFALKIQEESRVRTIGSIVVLSTVVLMFALMALLANPLVSPAIKDALASIFSTGGWTNYDWAVGIFMVVAVNVIYALVFGFIGLYAGSMLKKPKKT